MIIDCFPFYNELDMLKYRLETLHPFVDYFVIVEATRTHVGSPKPLYFTEHQYLFAPYLHKIIHIVEKGLTPVDTNSLKEQQAQKKTDYTTYCWDNARTQRNAIDRGIQKLEKKLSREKMEKSHIIISDCDEIPHPHILKALQLYQIDLDVTCLEQDVYYYNIRNRMKEKSHDAKIVSYSFYKQKYERNPEKIRQDSDVCVTPQGGWHLSYFGDPLFIKNKLQQSAHQEYNTPDMTNTQIIQRKIKNHQSVVRDESLEYILEHDNLHLPPGNYLTYFPIPPSD